LAVGAGIQQLQNVATEIAGIWRFILNSQVLGELIRSLQGGSQAGDRVGAITSLMMQNRKAHAAQSLLPR
jgi:hypothetical protein